MATAPKAPGASKRDLLEVCKKQGISFLRLQFTDILGINKRSEERRVGKECRSRWSPYH